MYKPVLNDGNQQVTISYKYNGDRVFYDLFYADDFDKQIFNPPKGRLFRLSVHASEMMLIVSIDVDKDLIYFVHDYDAENIEFETRGIKLDYSFKQFLE